MTKYIPLPDDDELITSDWVYANFGSMGSQYSARQRADIKCLAWENRFERFTLYRNPLPQIKTRGQIRMLVFVLAGITDLNRPENKCIHCGQFKKDS